MLLENSRFVKLYFMLNKLFAYKIGKCDFLRDFKEAVGYLGLIFNRYIVISLNNLLNYILLAYMLRLSVLKA